nr:hypothetical protein [Acidithiobacillus thiooxidans]
MSTTRDGSGKPALVAGDTGLLSVSASLSMTWGSITTDGSADFADAANVSERLSVPQEGQKALPRRSAPQDMHHKICKVLRGGFKGAPHWAQNLRLGAFSV